VEWCGLIVDHLRQVLKKPNLQPSYVEVPQDQMLRVVASGGVHLMCAAVSDTPERRRSLGFSEPIFHSEVKLLVPTRAAARSAADLKGRTVAVLGRTSTEQAVTAFSAARGLDIKLSRVVSAEAAMGQLVLGHADAWARDEVLLLGARSRQAQPADWRLLPESLGGEAVGIAFAPDAGLQRVVDQAMAKAVRSGLAEQMHQRWFQKANVLAPSGLNLPLSPALVQAWRVFTP
jgi:ABC-type amino acid transport substrate-binding protein